MAKTGFVFVKNTLNSRVKKYISITSPGGSVDIAAKKAVALQLLNNVINGSLGASVVPPIMTGRLRASGSVFVGGNFIKDSGDEPVDGESGTPNKSHSDKVENITIGFNTEYAAKWHEKKFTPGGKKPSKIAKSNPAALANVGNKYLEKHLQADGKELMELYADTVRSESSKA